jgi:histidinol-phosphatase (PHP family)
MDSYHNHTDFSDAKATVAEMTDAAEQAGLDEFGISDHLVIHPEGQTCRWGMRPERLEEYAAEVRRVGRSSRMPVRLGVEADFFPETVEETRRLLARHDFDFIIGSVHFAGEFLADETHRPWAKTTAEQRQAKWALYWGLVRQLAASRAFDFVAHLDIPKKFGLQMEQEAPQSALAALDAIAEAGMAVELNTSGWNHPCREAYPSPALLRQARERGIPILINADAHSPADVARSFGPALLLAREAGYTQTVRYAARRRSFIGL